MKSSLHRPEREMDVCRARNGGTPWPPVDNTTDASLPEWGKGGSGRVSSAAAHYEPGDRGQHSEDERGRRHGK